MDVKERIINESILQFNTMGVENVTTRHIAKELGISQGNLHYHYPNKNIIIKTIYNIFLHSIKNSSYYIVDELFEKETILHSMISNYTIMFNYRFLFIDNEIVWRRVPEIKTLTLQLFESKKETIKAIIESYKAENMFRKNITNEQINNLIDQFIFTISSWLNASSYISHKEDPIIHFAKFTFRQWLPYLSDNEMLLWENLLNINLKTDI